MKNNPNNPKHIGIIMDGNRRWAKANHTTLKKSYEVGINAVKGVIEACEIEGVDELTIYAFSTENWNRSEEEIQDLKKIFENLLYGKDILELIEKGAKIRFAGDVSEFGQKLHQKSQEIELLTPPVKKLSLNIAINYGSRQEITLAVQSCIKNGDSPSEENISKYMLNDVNLIIRTGGNKRLSNFLLWQGYYAEIYFTKTLWPDFDKEEFASATQFWRSQQKNFGK